ncbi:GGDEF domain protein [Ketogulonicigenium robustum]|uniref:diguanylate cyclase n=1 Tax=Ketogulonicigenium robustum TaxID=92947 RepID=A0A1W6NYA3_9RHOB|nr:diguanylate cyclase [Ketogulonicigenium robustum]ARO14161.1 GGDEF domain protein [Ketogulonicigenium robustum]
MSGEILVVGADSARREGLRDVLSGAHYSIQTVASLAEATAYAAVQIPDVVMLDVSGPTEQWPALITLFQGVGGAMPPWLIAVSPAQDNEKRLAALRAGAQDVIGTDCPSEVIQAKVRATLRQRDLMRDLQPNAVSDGDAAFGFAEAPSSFATAGRIAVVSARAPAAQPQGLQDLLQRWPGKPVHLAPDDLPLDPYVAVPDLFVIDATTGDARDICRQIAAARGKSNTRHTPTLVLLESGAVELAATTLDLGASDQVFSDIGADEFAHRARNLIHSKNKAERLRNRMRSQLEAAITDQLTGLHNRVYALPRLVRLTQRARDEQRAYSVMMIDIDHFKSINDKYGHMVGDQVLVGVAQQLRGNLRAIDMIARFGGEEFLVAMPDTDITPAIGVAERLLRKISVTPVQVKLPQLHDGAPATTVDIPITVSIGVAPGRAAIAGSDARLTIEEICAAADEALYKAKNAGRNRVMRAAGPAY